ncbi:MAG: hypothetical protein Q4G43_17935, partial [Mobilicoccus sp.]|nr:hypothetical protein [Mobilicoccus sp.]
MTFVVASTAITAHTLNATKLVRGLTERGHRVLWYADPRFTSHVVRTGAQHLPAPTASERMSRGVSGLTGLRAFYRDDVVGSIPAHLAAFHDHVKNTTPDAILSDTLLPAAGIAAAQLGCPWATFGDGPLLHWDQSTPPFGTGLQPMRGPAGRHRNRNVQRVIDLLLYDDAIRHLNAIRTRHGLTPAATIREASLAPELHLQGCTPSLEYPRDPLPDHIHFVGALGPGPGAAPPLPDHLRRAARTRHLAFLTQGTLRPNPRELARPAAMALLAEGFDVAAAGLLDGPWNPDPSRVHVLHRVDYADALAH